MNTCCRPNLTKLLTLSFQNGVPLHARARNYHVTSQLLVGGFWRQRYGLPTNPNTNGPLTDLPDYTFLDGRRTPVGSGKLRRYKEQQVISERIIKLTEEVDFAVENHKNRLEERKLRRQEILNRKLKPKGDSLRSSEPQKRLSDTEVK